MTPTGASNPSSHVYAKGQLLHSVAEYFQRLVDLFVHQASPIPSMRTG